MLWCGLMSGCVYSTAQPRIVAELPQYSEGIVFDTKGIAFVSILSKESVYAIDDSHRPTIWYRTKEPNGHKMLPDGTHLIAARGGIHRVNQHGDLIEVLAPQLSTPNDLALDGDGGVYVTVPAESAQDREAKGSGVYYLNSRSQVLKVASEFCYPNGIVVRADGKSLLVDDSCNRRIYEFQIASPGVLTDRRVWAEIPHQGSVPDGMTQDRLGRVYMADYGRGVVVVFDEAGQAVREYTTGLDHASNVAFGGEDCTNLFVTGSVGDGEGSGRLLVLPLTVAIPRVEAPPASTPGR